MIPVLPRQRACLNFIESFTASRGVAPSYDEIGEALGLKSKNSVHRVVTGLENRGAIRRTPGRPRTIEVVKSDAMNAVLLTEEAFALARLHAGERKISVDAAVCDILHEHSKKALA